MGEIDDLYKEKIEALDDKFLEDLEKGGDRKRVTERYLNDVSSAKADFSKNYKKFLRSEKKRIWSEKKKPEKNEAFKHLEIKHFDFKPTAWEIFKMRADLLWFGIKRFFHGSLIRALPSKIIYFYYKTIKLYRRSVEDLEEYYDKKKTQTIEISIKVGSNMLAAVKYLYTKTKEFFVYIFRFVGFKMEKKKILEEEAKGEKKEGASKGDEASKSEETVEN